jgi:hypothetical protein
MLVVAALEKWARSIKLAPVERIVPMTPRHPTAGFWITVALVVVLAGYPLRKSEQDELRPCLAPPRKAAEQLHAPGAGGRAGCPGRVVATVPVEK